MEVVWFERWEKDREREKKNRKQTWIWQVDWFSLYEFIRGESGQSKFGILQKKKYRGVGKEINK